MMKSLYFLFPCILSASLLMAQHCIYVADSGNDLYSYINGTDSKLCDLPDQSGDNPRISTVEALAYDPDGEQLYIVEDGSVYRLNHNPVT